MTSTYTLDKVSDIVPYHLVVIIQRATSIDHRQMLQSGQGVSYKYKAGDLSWDNERLGDLGLDKERVGDSV